MSDLPWIISVDDHVLEPPDLWQSRLAGKFKANGPRVERKKMAFGGHDVGWVESDDGAWCDVWLYDQMRAPS